MKITVGNFRGCRSAVLSWDGIALIGGFNGSGKTSLCQAVALAANIESLPFNLAKKYAAQLVTDEAKGLSCVDVNGTTIRLPDLARNAPKAGPFILSPYGTGQKNPIDMSPAERQAELEPYLLSEITPGDLPEGLIRDQVKAVGIDAVLTDYQNQLTLERGFWAKRTGQKWGSKIGASWSPEGYVNATPEVLKAAYEEAAVEVERLAISKQLNVKQKEYAAKLAASIPKLIKERDGILERMDDIKNGLAEVKYEVDKIRPKYLAFTTQGQTCPACECEVFVVDGKIYLQEWGGVTQAMIAQVTEEWNEVGGSYNRGLTAEKETGTKLAVAEEAIRHAERNRDELAKTAKEEEPVVGDLDAAREALAKAQKALAAFTQFQEAADIHDKIMKAARICEELPVIKRRVLAAGLAEFMKDVNEFASLAWFGKIIIDPDFNILYNGRLIQYCSAGEQFRCGVILRLIMSRLKGDGLIVIDGSDILDREGISGLVNLLNEEKITALIAMTHRSHDEIPDFREMGIGKTYWMEEGEANGI